MAIPPVAIDRRGSVEALRSLIVAVESESVCLAGHSDRVAAMAYDFALVAGWSAEAADQLHQAALVHDVGKIALRREVLAKQDPLSPKEYEHLKSHALLGARMVAGVLDLDQARWVCEHHERWDGGGYPFGRSSSQISEGGRMLAIADSFDAMTSERRYRPAMTAAEALAEVRANEGTQFAPDAASLLTAVLGPVRTPAAASERRTILTFDEQQRLGDAFSPPIARRIAAIAQTHDPDGLFVANHR